MPAPNIITSVEVRWFFKEAPVGIKEWFDTAFGSIEPEPPRLDCYLPFPDVHFAGVKLREYPPEGPRKANKLNLEFKLRDHDFGIVTFSGGIVGLMEKWSKWTAPVGKSADVYMQETGGNWSFVEKRRKLVTFAVTRESVELHREETRLDQGCNLELTEIQTGDATALRTSQGEPWWSLCFEGFSFHEGTDIAVVLKQTVDHVFQTYGVPPLNAEQSFSYPYWLADISKER